MDVILINMITIQVKIDTELCTGRGHCEEICPQVFKVSEGKATVLTDPILPHEEDLVYQAIKRCPRQAISFS